LTDAELIEYIWSNVVGEFRNRSRKRKFRPNVRLNEVRWPV